MEHHYIQCNGVLFHYVTQGEGPLVLLLHGFPENYFSWRYQMAPLSQYFKVVAPDLRGYNLTEKKGPYDIKTLCNDVRELIENLGYEKAIIVAHDWGSLIMWDFALDYPGMCKKLISLNVPYFPRGPKPLHEMLSYSRFDYMRDFQKPGNAESIIESDIDHFIKRVFITYAASENYITEDELKVFSNSFKNPGDITPALEYYRNLTLNWKLTENRAYKKIRTPTLMIVGDLDPLLTPDMFLGVEKYVPNVTVKHISCGHWMQQEAPKKTNEYILEFIL